MRTTGKSDRASREQVDAGQTVKAAAEESAITVVYIMGYGRSGSTILDILLSQHGEVVGAGELSQVYRCLMDNEKCACNAPIRQCTFWKDVCDQHLRLSKGEIGAMARLQRAVESMMHYPALVLGLKSKRQLRRYADQVESLFRAIADASGKRYVVDSSKSARHYSGRPLALFKHTGLNVKIIHLVRDGRGVGWSEAKCSASPEHRRWSEWRTVNYLRALASWIVTNHLALVTTSILPRDAVLRVRYEDLCESPADVVARIGKFVGLDMRQTVEAIGARKELHPGHNVGGNRVRFAKGLNFKPDHEWRKTLPRSYRGVFALAAWPLTVWFDYR